MADRIELAVDTSVDARDITNFGKTLDRVADAGETMGKELEDALEEAQRAARPTASEYKRLASDLERYARQSGKSMSDAFDDFERHATDAGLDVSDSTLDALSRISQQAPRDVDKVSAAFKDLARDADTAAGDVKGSFEGNQITPDDLFAADFKAEVVSNMIESGAEVVRGFKDGFDSEDVGSIVDGLSDTAIQAGAVFGPAGAAAGGLFAAGLQVVTGDIVADAEEKAAQFEETFTSAFDNIVESGAEMGRELAIQAATDALAQDAEKYNDVLATSTRLGVERGIVLRAMAGDQDAYNIVMGAAKQPTQDLNDQLADLREQYEAGELGGDAYRGMVVQVSQRLSEAERQVKTVTDSFNNQTAALNAGYDAASAKAEADNYAAEKALNHAAAMATTTGQAQDLEVRIDGVTRAFRVMPDGKTIDVTDGGSVDKTQQDIDGISGSFVTVDVQAPGLSEIESRLAQLANTTFRPTVGAGVLRPEYVGGPKP